MGTQLQAAYDDADEIERLHDHQEFKRAVIEARIDELRRVEPKGDDRPLIWTTGRDRELAMTLDERIVELEAQLSKEEV